MFRELFSSFAFLLMTTATLFSALGINLLSRVKAENIAPVTFEFMIYLTLISAGIAGVCASPLTPTFRRFTRFIMHKSVDGMYSATAVMIGWPVGLAIYALIIKSWQGFYSCSVTVFLLLIMVYQPIHWAKTIEDLSEQKLDNWFKTFRFPKTFFLMSIMLVALGCYGMWTLSS